MIDTLNQWTGGNAPIAIAVITLAVVYALARTIRSTRAIREGASWGPRIGKYIGIVAQGWLLTLAVFVLIWCLAMRDGYTFAGSLDYMGLHTRLPATDVAVWSAAMVAAATLASAAVTYVRRAFGGGPTAAGLDVIPETPTETAFFSLLVAPTGGIGEEIVYRGFLIGQLWGLTGNAWVAALLSSALFGAMHVYQGWWGVLRTSLIGFIFAVGLIMTGSLIPSIIAHTLANMLGVIFRKPVAPQPAAS